MGKQERTPLHPQGVGGPARVPVRFQQELDTQLGHAATALSNTQPGKSNLGTL
jgi:hypothetical protein